MVVKCEVVEVLWGFNSYTGRSREKWVRERRERERYREGEMRKETENEPRQNTVP